MKQTEAVDFNNTENQNTSKEKMDMSDKMITLDRKDKNLIYENTEMRVFMYGIRHQVNGRKKIWFAVQDVKSGRMYTGISSSMKELICKGSVFDEFYDYGFDREGVACIKENAVERMVTMEYEETQETELSIEEIKDRLIELAEHNKEHESWKILCGEKIYYNIPTGKFKELCKQEFDFLSYRQIVQEFKMRGYLKCNDGRNDYKKNAKGVRGICLLAGEVSYGEQKSAEDSTGTERKAA